MPRPRKKGVVARLSEGRYKVRVDLADGSFTWRTLKQITSEERARDYSVNWSQQAQEEGLRSPARHRGAPGETFGDWFERRCKARRKKGLSSVADDEGRFTWVGKFECPDGVKLSEKQMATIATSDLEGFVQFLDRSVQEKALAWKTAINVWAVVTGSFRDACRSKVLELRVRADNPASEIEGPDRGADRSKVFTYPSEFLAFTTCSGIPSVWRRLVAVAVYLGGRASELEALEWEDLDLEHGKVTIHRTIDREVDDSGNETKVVKDKEPRTFGLEPNLLPLLRAMAGEVGGTGRVFPDFPRQRDLAEHLRDYMRVAGVTRPELFVSDETRINLRFHDLRASTVTWMAVREDSAERIMQRVGHEDWPTMKRYMRTAEAIAIGFGEPFPPLPQTLLDPPGFDPVLIRTKLTLRNNSGADGTRKRRSHHGSKEMPGKSAISADGDGATEWRNLAKDGGGSKPDQNSDPLEAALTKALEVASAAGDLDRIDRIVGELRARRESHAGNVVALPSRRRKGNG